MRGLWMMWTATHVARLCGIDMRDCPCDSSVNSSRGFCVSRCGDDVENFSVPATVPSQTSFVLSIRVCAALLPCTALLTLRGEAVKHAGGFISCLSLSITRTRKHNWAGCLKVCCTVEAHRVAAHSIMICLRCGAWSCSPAASQHADRDNERVSAATTW